jgi:uncharacterized protein (DUF736 family)
MQYDNTNSGAIFPAREKKTEKHPDMTGSLNVDGVEYYVSGWTKVSQKGQKFLSLSVNPKQQVAKQNVKQAQQVVADDFDDDSLPF